MAVDVNDDDSCDCSDTPVCASALLAAHIGIKATTERATERAGDSTDVGREVCVRKSAETQRGVPRNGKYLRFTRNGMTPEFRAWKNAVSRCHDSRDKDFVNYGGRGVAVCDDWRFEDLGGFDAFVEHIGKKPGRKFTIGRIDNSRGYEPGDVRWETWTQQANNRRGNRIVIVDGISMTAAEWARNTGIGLIRQHVIGRLEMGWHPKAAVLSPPGSQRGPAHAAVGLRFCDSDG